MLVRIAYFEGSVRAGRDAEFDRFIMETLLPIWKQTPNALRVEVLREVETDEAASRYPLVLQIAYPDRPALEEALASPIRTLGREATKGLMAMFDGRVFHVVYEV